MDFYNISCGPMLPQLVKLCKRESLEISVLRDQVEKLKHQVTGLEQDRDVQKDMKLAFKLQAARLGEALRECQEAIADNSRAGIAAERTQAEIICDARFDHPNQRLLSLQREAVQNGWAVQSSRFQLQEKIGKGTSAITYKGSWHGLEVAVKCIHPLYFKDPDGVNRFCQEIELLLKQRHPYIIHLLAANLHPPEKAWIVTEYFPLTLMEWLHGSKKRQLQRTHPLPPRRDRLRIALEVALGMQFLHELDPKIVHRDLKPSNIFLDNACHARIADFGMGRYLQRDERSLTGEIGTYIYMAPEVIRHEAYDESCDVYSFGVILCELMTGDSPYIHTSARPFQIAVSVAYDNLRPELPNPATKEMIELIQAAWHKHPSERPTFADIVCFLNSQREL